MFTNILVPIDFSEHATSALRLAIKVARESKGQLTLLHIGLAAGVGSYDLGGYGVPVPDTLIQLHEEAARQQQHALAQIAREEIPAEIPWRGVAREGNPQDEIVAQAREGQHDLIVMGTHGRGGLQRAFLGSVTEKVLRHAECPVLVTR